MKIAICVLLLFFIGWLRHKINPFRCNCKSCLNKRGWWWTSDLRYAPKGLCAASEGAETANDLGKAGSEPGQENET